MSDSFSSVRVELRSSGVAWVEVARPAVSNAFDEQMIDALDAAFAALGANPQVRVVVLAAQGKHFSAGADLQWMQRASEASAADNLTDARRDGQNGYDVVQVDQAICESYLALSSRLPAPKLVTASGFTEKEPPVERGLRRIVTRQRPRPCFLRTPLLMFL
jgi:1,4-dihydroxy-2-naphthoyl-CoA synthase